MSRKEHTLWVEKYRPKVLEDYVGNENIKKTIQQYLNQNDIQNFIKMPLENQKKSVF
jgi:Holliday junction resolvasome RuvABC ATP-dependent DNA helicase subunit